MSDRSLKGRSLGAKSMADSSGIELAARVEVGFDCPNGHHFNRTFAEEAELPAEWECPRCGHLAPRIGAVPEAKVVKPQRTHWDMLRERRSIAELEEILAERLEEIRKDH